MDFRIGINVGDVMADKNDLFGDGVNVAARLEGFAEPGRICISGAVRDHIDGKLTFALTALGERSRKNFTRPTPVYSVDWRRPEHPVATGVLGGTALAVLLELGIYLRERGSHESKPVAAPHAAAGH